MTPSELTALHLALPTGADQGTSVKALATALGWNEPRVRRGFQLLRRDRHIPVVALPIAGGVFVATDDDLADLKRTREGLHSRAINLLVTCRDLDEMIADSEWSPTLFQSAS